MERQKPHGQYQQLRQEAFQSALDSLDPDERKLIDGLITRVQEAQIEQSRASTETGRVVKGFGQRSALEFVGAVGMLLAENDAKSK